MRLFDIELFKKEKNGVDKLGNPLYQFISFKTGEGRKSIWTAQEIALDSRIVTKKLQKIVTTLSREDLSKTDRLILKDEKFTIEEIKGEDDDRWRVISVTSYGK